MAIQSLFPSHLLNQSNDARLEYFKDHWAAHKRIKLVAEQVLSLIREPANVGLIHLVGPTGVGKSTVLKYVMTQIFQEALPSLEKDRGWIPAAYMLALNPQTGAYDWTEHFVQTLLAVQEVLIDRKIALPDSHQDKLEFGADIGSTKGSSRALRRAAAKALKNRRCKAFLIDDAQYILKRRSGEQLINQADTIKSFVAQSETLHLLAGTYELLLLRNLNGQYGRLSVTIHFSNYKYEVEDDVIAFIEALNNFLAHLPLKKTPDFKDHWEFCYERCLGCVGILKDWLTRALSKALENNRPTLSFELLKACAPPASVCLKIAQEIHNDEDTLNVDQDESTYALLRATLGMNSKHSQSKDGKPKQAEGGAPGMSVEKSKPNSAKGRHKGRIESDPDRYPLGTDENDLVH